MLPPLAVDIDGTLTRPDDRKAIDPRVFEALRTWAAEAPVVVATGKSMPYPVGLCDFVGIPVNVVSENGGAVYVEGSERIVFNGDREAAQAVADDYVAAGYDLGWGPVDLVNRWRATEVAVSIQSPLEPLEELAERHGMDVVDTGYAYHVVSPGVNKGRGLRTAAAELGVSPAEFVAVGDSENDAEAFTVAGQSFAVANADDIARETADEVLGERAADGFLRAVELVRQQFA
jgi:phosphoglycolate phosphatase (TIGR01487 family)